MAFRAKIQEVNVEKVQKGRSNYSVAHVNYLYNGAAKTVKIMSFSNPQVFDAVQKLVGKDVEVTTTQANGYTNWSQVVEASGGGGNVGSPGSTSGKVSTYETAEERKLRQLYIIRQSSIANAIAFLKDNGEMSVDNVLQTAQQFVDFVYDNNLNEASSMGREDEEVSFQ